MRVRAGVEVGGVLAALLAGSALASVLLARYGDRVGRRRAYRVLLLAMGGAGAVFALTSWPPAGIEVFDPWRIPFINTLILLLSGLFLLSSLGIGLLASTFANTQQEAMLTVWMTLLPAVFLSGFFFPLQAMPKVLQAISYLFPLRYYLNIIRSLMLKAGDVSTIRGEIIALCIFGFLLMTFAALRFRKRLD